MTPNQMGALYSAIHADPVAKEFARVGNDQAVADRLNLPTVLVHRRISAGRLLRWSAARAVMQKLQSEATNGTNGKKSISQAALTMLQSGTAELVLDGEVMGMVNHLVPDVLSADDVADLLQRCAEHISTAEQVIGRQCTVGDVGEVLLVDRPNGKIPRMEAV
jgi:UDP-N-acetylmuramyl tripeptide synthase